VHERRVAREEVARERADLLAPLAQRRQLHREDREPVVEVGAEGAAGHHLLEVPVGRGDDAQVDRRCKKAFVRPRRCEILAP
jgi:hypothetical protein